MLGIDVSKATLSCALLNAQTQKTVWYKEVPNTTKGIKKLLRQTPPASSWILEPTGRYGQEVARLAREDGRQVLLAQPQKAHYFLKGVQHRAKTDRLDAKGLALYGACSTGLLPYPLKDAMHDELDQLLAARKGISDSVRRLEAQKRDLPRAAKALEPSIEALKGQRKQLDRQIVSLTEAAEFKIVEGLQKVPGIGPIVSATVGSCLTSHQFSHSDQFVAYCGLDVRICQSGQRRGYLTLSKQGPAELRRLLFVAAKASLNAKESPFKAQYEREQKKGLSTTAALCAVARKMARLCWSIAHYGTSYDPERVYQQPDPQNDTSSEGENAKATAANEVDG